MITVDGPVFLVGGLPTIDFRAAVRTGDLEGTCPTDSELMSAPFSSEDLFPATVNG
jgi:hypothetical protein